MTNKPHSSLFGRIGRKFTSSEKQARQTNTPKKLHKRNIIAPLPSQQEGINELGEREYSTWSETTTLVGTRDHTDMLHGLAHHGSFDSLVEGTRSRLQQSDEEELDEAALMRLHEVSEKNKKSLDRLSSDLWEQIASFLDPADVAHLAMTSRMFLEKLGNEPLELLRLSQNHLHRIRFLNHMDAQLPSHLLCFPCGTYHRRINRGNEQLTVNFVNSPLYNCPKATSSYLPRMRLAHGRELPYSFVQLTTRQAAHSTHHGIPPDSLSRRWKDPSSGWSHTSRYMIHDGRLLLRVRSQIFAPPKPTPTAERKLLYDPEEYTPFFSVCAHWRDGVLMKVCKCALSHVPAPPESLLHQIRQSPRAKDWVTKPTLMVRQCDFCRPARRCPDCPSEYQVEVSIKEDKKDAVNRFKHALVVTRWCDLGDGKSPTASPEYCAINGINSDYDSFSNVGRRAVAGVFESKVSGSIPGQRMISMNPRNERLGEQGHGWY